MKQAKVKVSYSDIYDRADKAGLAAAAACRPIPMIVGTPKTPFGDEIDTNKKTYFVSDGVCGFAWVRVKVNTGFAKWLRKTGKVNGGPSYGGGYLIGDSRIGGQSMQIKEAYHQAFAEVLYANGIHAYMESRMD